MGSRQWAERHQLWQVNPLFYYWGDQRDRECSQNAVCAVRNKGGNSEVGCNPWGKGGHIIRVSRMDGSGGVAEEHKDLQEGFFFSRQEMFLVARA